MNAVESNQHLEEAFRPPAPFPKKMLALSSGDLLSALPDICFERPFIHVGTHKRPIVILNDPPLIKTLLLDEADNFPKSTLMIKAFEPLLGNGLLISNGSDWRRQRRMLEGAFSQMRVRSVFEHMTTAIERFTDRMVRFRSTEISLPAEMSALALEVIHRTILSVGLSDGEAADVYRAFSTYQRLVPEAAPLSLVGRVVVDESTQAALQAASQTLRGLIGELVDARSADRSGHERKPDVLQAIVDARDPADGKGFTREEMIDQVAVLFLAGHETSANAMTWALYILSQQNDWADALRQEADVVAPGRFLSFDDVQSLTLARQVFLETLRLYPPAGFLTRIAVRSTTLGGHDIAAGTLIIISPWIVHRHHKLWNNPDRFIPSRFSKENESAIPVGAFVPFGWGPRICTGRALALTEIPFFIAEVNRRFRIEVTNDIAVEPVARLTIQPKDDILCRLMPRNAA